MTNAVPNRGYLALFRKPAFILMWLAQTLSNLGDGVARIALVLLVTEKTTSPIALTLVAFSQALPTVLFAPLAGVLVDQSNRKTLMVSADCLRAGLIFAVALSPGLPLIYVLSFLVGTLGTVFNPARSAVMPEMAGTDNYMASVAMTQTGAQAMMVIGPALGGTMVGFWGIQAAIVFDAITFAISALIISLLPIPGLSGTVKTNAAFQRDAGAGLRVMWANNKLRFVIGVYMPVILVMGSIGVLLVDYMRNGLRAGGEQLGLVESLLAFGVITSTFLVGQFGQKVKPGRLILNSISGLGLVTTVFLFKPNVPLVLAWAVLIGLADGLSDVPMNTLLLNIVPKEYRGRVFASFNAVMRLAGILSLAVSGPLAALFGAHIVLGAGGLIVVLVGILARFTGGYQGLNG